MIKKSLIVLFSGLLMLSACGGGNTTDTTSDVNSESTSEATSDVTSQADLEGYVVTFNVGENGFIAVYTDKTLETIDPDNVHLTRNGDTGEYDKTGEGQVNFIVTPNDGYRVDTITATEGLYSNIKAEDALNGIYRVTKITVTLKSISLSKKLLMVQVIQ